MQELHASKRFSVCNMGDALRLAKLITRLHNHPLESRAHVVGITGSGGCGKSTFIAEILPVLRAKDLSVIVLAIDPSSSEEYNGGALLGDRTRMCGRTVDPGVFIRSLATRSGPGSLTEALPEIIGACKYFADVVLVETAGSGQADTQIRKFVDTLVLVLPPMGDDITLMKSGQTEHAHIIAVNTRQEYMGSDRFLSHAQSVLGHDVLPDGWQKKIFRVDAMENEGVEAFVNEGLLIHREFLKNVKK